MSDPLMSDLMSGVVRWSVEEEERRRRRRELTCKKLEADDLRVVVGMLRGSLGGAILGSALLWQQACLGETGAGRAGAATMGAMGAVAALGGELREAFEERQLQGHAMVQLLTVHTSIYSCHDSLLLS